MAKNNSQIS